MRLTREEARKWAEILKGFSEGKRYQIPYVMQELFDNFTFLDGSPCGISE